MNTYVRSTIFALVAGLAVTVFVTGCSPTKNVTTVDEQTHAYTDSMMCPKCETVWARERDRHGAGQVTRISYSREMTCPDCDAMAQSQLLEDGKVMLHECPTCKVTPLPVKSKETRHFANPAGNPKSR